MLNNFSQCEELVKEILASKGFSGWLSNILPPLFM